MNGLSIPRKIRVGKRLYSVEILEAMCNKNHMGQIDFNKRLIQLSRKTHTGAAYTADDVTESFWHELVHAILYDMGEHKLNSRENFVEEFSARLAKAIKTARF